MSSRCSESSIWLSFKTSDLDPFLGARWTHVHFLFVAKSISGAHLVPLWAPTEASFVSLDALYHSQRITARPRVTFCSFLGPICCPWGFSLGVAPISLLSTCIHCLHSGGFLLAIWSSKHRSSRNSSEEVRAVRSAAPNF